MDAAALSDLAQSVEGSEGVTFVPALAGLGALHWNNKARGTITGLALATTRAHLARATLEAVALQVADVFTAMEQDVGHRLDGLRADGGALANDFLMQLQVNFLDRPVMRGEGAEVGALGVASMAFEAIGVPMAYDIAFQPQIDPERRDEVHEGWHRALAQVLSNETTFQASRGLGLGI